MSPHVPTVGLWTVALLGLTGVCFAWAETRDEDGASQAVSSDPSTTNPLPTDPQQRQQLFSGKVVLLPDALKPRGLSVAEEMARQVVLELADGHLIPLLADWRGRAFFQDERLRNRPVELVGSLRPGLPYLQVLMVFTFDEDGHRQYTDYWCDVCSIPMYEIQPCECCQGEIRLRFQRQDLPAAFREPTPTP
ncbi:MAG: hypothetical protein KF861_02215 [Planctomycetaceae bacterium]|nr:hypothetical protein [Planctomycetaceae bacterium]